MNGKNNKWLLSALTALIALGTSACGHSPLAAGMSPYGQNPYQQNSPYAQNGQNTAYGAQNAYGQDTSGGFAFASEGAYPSAAPSLDPNGYPTDSGYGDSGYGDAYGAAPSASPTPKASASPVDRAPDPIPAAVFSGVSDELNVLSYNVWGLPGLLGTKRKERFERLGATLNAYDVVALQEAFSDDIEALKQSSGFPHHFRLDNGTLLKTNSGLYILSKYPITKTASTTFNHCTGANCLANKGVLMVRVEHPKIGPVDVYTTQFQDDDSAKAKTIRTTENNRVLQEFILRNSSSYPVIIAGDFNSVPDQAEYADLMKRMPLTDVYSRLNPKDPGYTLTPDNPMTGGEGTPKRVDYIFALQKTGVEITPLESKVTHQQPVDGVVLSDHYGVSAKLRIKVKK